MTNPYCLTLPISIWYYARGSDFGLYSFQMIFTVANPSLSNQPVPATQKSTEAVASQICEEYSRGNSGKMKGSFGLCVQDPLMTPIQFYLRLFGLICCCLSVIQVGTGSAASVYLAGLNNGSWWGTICVFIAGTCALIAKNRSWVTAITVFSFFGFITALIGAINDSLSSKEFSSLRSCGSVSNRADVTNDDFKSYLTQMVSYGNSADGIDISYCMASYNLLKEFNYDTCYCVTAGGGFCGAYVLSGQTVDRKQNCGHILTTYSRTLEASQSLCVISAFAMLILFILSCYLLQSPHFLYVGGERSNSSPVDDNEMTKLHVENRDQYDADSTSAPVTN